MPHAEESSPALAADAKRFHQDVLERFAGFEPFAKLDGLLAKLGIGHRLIPLFERIDRFDARLQLADVAGVRGAEDRRYASLEAVHQTSHEVPDAVPRSL